MANNKERLKVGTIVFIPNKNTRTGEYTKDANGNYEFKEFVVTKVGTKNFNIGSIDGNWCGYEKSVFDIESMKSKSEYDSFQDKCFFSKEEFLHQIDLAAKIKSIDAFFVLHRISRLSESDISTIHEIIQKYK